MRSLLGAGLFCLAGLTSAFGQSSRPVQLVNGSPPVAGPDPVPRVMEVTPAEITPGVIIHPSPYGGKPAANKEVHHDHPWGQPATETAAVQLDRFFSFPVTREKPALITTDPESGAQVPADEAQFLYEMRMQHWTFLFDAATYEKAYGRFTGKCPGGMSAAEYRANPPSSAFLVPVETSENGH